MSENVKVAVRVRPFNEREKKMNAKCCIEMHDGKTTVIKNLEDGSVKKFTFDHSYDSMDSNSDNFASQQKVWDDIGVGVLDNAYKGYNVSLFAYGQTGSGKSYSMMGYPAYPINPGSGIVPIASQQVFKRIDENEDANLTYQVECSMLEIYMEKVHDLFNPKSGNLKVRNHPKTGPYVDKLTKSTIGTFDQVEKLMDAGTKARTVASTNMNATSSRAHTIFQLIVTQTRVNTETMKATDMVSIINLIDLAGSERQSGTGASGQTLKEGCAINQSLSALGNVISALAKNSGEGKKELVPYRSSVLTQLLKNSLGGNAKTVMIAAVSPASINYPETLSTLRYADRAKQIKNKAIVNEDPNQKLIRSLKAQIEELKAQLSGGAVVVDESAMEGLLEKEREEMREKLEQEQRAKFMELLNQNEDLLKENSKTWEERLKESEERVQRLVAGEREKEELNERKETVPHLTNLHEDAILNEKLCHFLEEGDTIVGRKDADPLPNICLSGLNIQQLHAKFKFNEAGHLVVEPLSDTAKLFVNGEQVFESCVLHHNFRVLFGSHHLWRVCIPDEVELLEIARSTKRLMDAGEDPPEDAAEWEEWMDHSPENIDFDMAMSELNAAAIAKFESTEDLARRTEKTRMMEKQMEELEAKLEQERARSREEVEGKKREFEEIQRKIEGQMKAHEFESKTAVHGTEMQTMLKEQEERLIAEHKLAAAAFEKEQQEMLKRQEELEASLKKQLEETKKLKAKQDQESAQLEALKLQLQRAIPRVNEANDIAQELGKPVAYELKPVVEGNTIKLKVKKHHDDLPVRLIDYETFDNKLYEMRELFQSWMDSNREPLTLPADQDPFEDTEESVEPQRIGTALLYLQPLCFLLPIQETIAIMDYKGTEQGTLDVEVLPHLTAEVPADLEELEEQLDEFETIGNLKERYLHITVRVVKAKGIPEEFSQGVFCQFKYFLDEETTKSEPLVEISANPLFEFNTTRRQLVTGDFCEFVEADAIQFEVHGNVVVKERSPMHRTSTKTLRRQFSMSGGVSMADKIAMAQAEADDAKKEAKEAQTAMEKLRDGIAEEKQKLAELEEREKRLAEREVEAFRSPTADSFGSVTLLSESQQEVVEIEKRLERLKELEQQEKERIRLLTVERERLEEDLERGRRLHDDLELGKKKKTSSCSLV